MSADEMARAEREERLRQARETFDQRRDHDERWFSLRTAMGWTAVIVLPIVCGPAAYVIVNSDRFSAKVIALASALLASALALFGAAWRMILGGKPPELAPVADLISNEIDASDTATDRE